MMRHDGRSNGNSGRVLLFLGRLALLLAIAAPRATATEPPPPDTEPGGLCARQPEVFEAIYGFAPRADMAERLYVLKPSPAGGVTGMVSEQKKMNPADPEWHRVWNPDEPYGLIEGRKQPLRTTPETTYAEILRDLPGLELLELREPQPAVSGQPLPPQPLRNFGWKNGRWAELWYTESIPDAIGNYPLAGDFDHDGSIDAAVLPARELRLYDPEFGGLKDFCRFTKGLSRGVFGFTDMNGDGMQEFYVLSNIDHHVDVLGFGKDRRISLLWRQELNDPAQRLRIISEPVARVDRNGPQMVILNFFNKDGKKRWLAQLRDGMTGQVKAELRDEVILASADLDGDGRAELLTMAAHGNRLPRYGVIRVRRYQTGSLKCVWEKKRSCWQPRVMPIPLDRHNHDWQNRLGVLKLRKDNCDSVCIRSIDLMRTREMLGLARWTGHDFTFDSLATGPGITGLAVNAGGDLLISQMAMHGKDSNRLRASKGALTAFAGVSSSPKANNAKPR